MIFSIPGDFLGFLSRICKGISDLYGFILYTFAISDRSVFKLSRVTWIHVNTCKLGFLSIPWRWFSRFCFRIIWIYFVYHGDSWSSFQEAGHRLFEKLQRETVLIYCFIVYASCGRVFLSKLWLLFQQVLKVFWLSFSFDFTFFTLQHDLVPCSIFLWTLFLCRFFKACLLDQCLLF